ncbi:hypothetical protein SAY87_027891 [Trapa incisa]|uniref:Uncharacterized protein n=1 Tax=Trapa incisa TaxID=236973 RepID=A0AAN7KT16_9MYRT|nr:hypothetical protein SAY87_027891 [Trapa incisa]
MYPSDNYNSIGLKTCDGLQLISSRTHDGPSFVFAYWNTVLLTRYSYKLTFLHGRASVWVLKREEEMFGGILLTKKMSLGFWMSKMSNNSNDDEMAFNCTSRLETKCSHQWLMDDPRIDLLPNRKQAVGLRNNHSFLESLNSSPSQWGIASGFHTSLGHFGEQSFDLESSGVNNYDGRGIPFSTSLRLHIPFGLPLDIGVGDDRIITLGITSGGDGSGVSTGTLHGIEDESASIGPTYEEDGDNVSVSQVMGKEHHCILSSGQGHQTDSCTMSMSQLYNQEGNNSSVSVGNSYDKTKNVASHKIGKGQSTIKSFGGCDDDPGRLIYNYEMLMGQPSVHIPNAIDSVGLVKSNDGGRIAVPGAGDNSKKGDLHMTEKIPSNNFPSNVRSLLSTGILDGVHVKYMAWSQEQGREHIILQYLE